MKIKYFSPSHKYREPLNITPSRFGCKKFLTKLMVFIAIPRIKIHVFGLEK
jgi:hypothetical protein